MERQQNMNNSSEPGSRKESNRSSEERAAEKERGADSDAPPTEENEGQSNVLGVEPLTGVQGNARDE